MPVKRTVKKSSTVKKSAKKTALKKQAPKKVEVHFTFYAPEAFTVAIGGTFNNWSGTASPMIRADNGNWVKTLELEPGEYQYLFRINDTHWEEAQEHVDKVPNEFGTYNCILRVH
jgi:1,4-alpha-glucan branching enzyme